MRPDGHGAPWRVLAGEEKRIKDWVEDGLNVKKIHDLLARQGVVVPYRTLARFATERCGAGGRDLTVAVADPEPGQELQVDFGRMGLLSAGERKKVCHALVFTACSSRHCFVWLTFSQTTAEVINGFEAAWAFFGGIFPVVIPDNLSPVVTNADALSPRFNDTFIEYAQSRGFVIDPARVRHPQDKPKVERTVQYVRGSFWAGEQFLGISDAQRRAVTWCNESAGMRVHGTTQLRPVEAFRATEAALLLPLAALALRHPYLGWSHCPPGLPLRGRPLALQRPLHIGRKAPTRPGRFQDGQVLPGRRAGQVPPSGRPRAALNRPGRLPARQGGLCHARHRPAGQKSCRCRPGGRRVRGRPTRAPFALDQDAPGLQAFGPGEEMGPERVDAACAKALDAEAIDVGLVGRIIERAKENEPEQERLFPNVVPGRFARQAQEFSANKKAVQ